jgi:hypothetical protein
MTCLRQCLFTVIRVEWTSAQSAQFRRIEFKSIESLVKFSSCLTQQRATHFSIAENEFASFPDVVVELVYLALDLLRLKSRVLVELINTPFRCVDALHDLPYDAGIR